MTELDYMTGALVLPDDIEIVSLADFPAAVRAQVDGDTHDYAVTRPRSRVPSKVINAQAAELLREFQKPTTLVEAILRFSKAAQRNPAQVLEDVYPFLESCLLAKLLVEPGSDSETIRPSFDKGAVVPNSVANCEVEDCIQVLDDTELYRVRLGDVEAALKIARLRSGQPVQQSLERESKILGKLNGQVAPRLLASGETGDGRSYLVMEWIPGELCGEAAAAMRAGADELLSAPLLLLCANILDAYATLHSLGVIHSDVHANNVLVPGNGQVRIIDHGLSRLESTDINKGEDHSEPVFQPRGGVGFFFEPEYAKAVLSDSMPPLSSRAGEQYSVAALVYFLLSGQHYVDFSYGKEAVLRQIAEQPPIPFSARGLPGANALDDVLFRALSKDPSARFADMAAMAAVFRDAIGRLHPSSPRFESHRDAGHLHDWLESTLRSLSDPTIELSVSGKVPTASLTFGPAGVAYGLFRIACAREDPQLFALAERWLDRAECEIGQNPRSRRENVYSRPETLGRISLHCSPSGVACVQALLAHSGGDLHTRSMAIQSFLESSDRACENPDLIMGRSGTLLAISLLVDAFAWDQTTRHEQLIEVGNELLADLWTQLDAMPPIGDPSAAASLGMAHGWAGYLYATLRWTRSALVLEPRNLRARLEQLANLAHRRGSRVFWPCDTMPDSPVFGGWCNGSAGFAFLWTLAHRQLRDPRWLLLAEGAAHDACHDREEGTSLYFGLTGKAHSQLSLYKHTGNRKWLDNASAMARLAIRKTEMEKSSGGTRIPLNLYEGDAGLAVLVADLDHPESSAMPLFEDEAWPTSRFHH
jgi:eukaryotic-like serine/threonine-protein kinase